MAQDIDCSELLGPHIPALAAVCGWLQGTQSLGCWTSRLNRPVSMRKRIVGHLSAVNIVDFDSARTDELVRLWRESFEFGVGVVDPHPIEDQRDHFVNTVVPNNAVRMWLSDDKLVGFIAATKESITHLYVRVGHHDCGVGSQLLSWAKAQSGGRLWLFAFARNAVARAFYAKHGFEIVGRGFEPIWQLDDIKYEWVA